MGIGWATYQAEKRERKEIAVKVKDTKFTLNDIQALFDEDDCFIMIQLSLDGKAYKMILLDIMEYYHSNYKQLLIATATMDYNNKVILMNNKKIEKSPYVLIGKKRIKIDDIGPSKKAKTSKIDELESTSCEGFVDHKLIMSRYIKTRLKLGKVKIYKLENRIADLSSDVMFNKFITLKFQSIHTNIETALAMHRILASQSNQTV